MTTSKNGSSAANAEYLELVMSFLLDTIGDELGDHLVRPIISIDDRVARGIGREGSQGPQHTLKEVRASGVAETTRRACRRGGPLPCREPPRDGRFHEIGRQEGKRDRHVDS